MFLNIIPVQKKLFFFLNLAGGVRNFAEQSSIAPDQLKEWVSFCNFFSILISQSHAFALFRPNPFRWAKYSGR